MELSLTLNTIKPGKKKPLRKEDCKLFELCFSPVPEHELVINKLNVVEKDNRDIYIVDNILSAHECEAIRRCMDSCDELSFWNNSIDEADPVASLKKLKMFRDAETVEVPSRQISTRIWDRLRTCKFSLGTNQIFDKHFQFELFGDETTCERELIGKWTACGVNHELLFAHYPPEGCFAHHTDGRTIHDFNTRSFYSIIVFLTDLPLSAGGGTRFYSDEAVKELQCHDGKHWTADPSQRVAEVASRAGRLLLFHQSLVHEGVPTSLSPSNLTQQDKYIIRSDLMFRRHPALCDSEQDRAAYALFQQAEEVAERGDVGQSVRLFQRALKMSPAMARIMGQA